MTARFYWTLTSGSIEEIVDIMRVDGSGTWPTISVLGEAGSGTVIVDDPNGTKEYLPWHQLLLMEDTINPNEASPFLHRRLWRGFISEIRMRKGPYVPGSARQWELTVLELNNFLQQRVVKPAHNGNRPAETDIQRLNWFLGTSWVTGRINTLNNHIDTSNPVSLDAFDYTWHYFGDVLTDLSNASGKNHFIYWDLFNARIELFYAKFDSTFYSSTLKISDVAGDADNDLVFSPLAEGYEYFSDPSRMYDAVVLPFSGGTVFKAGAADSGEVFRDGIAPAVEVKTSAKANTLAQRELDEIRDPDKTLRLTVQIPVSRIYMIRPGQRVQVKSSWVPNLSGYTYCRIREMTYKLNADRDLYDLDLILAIPDVSIGLQQSVDANVNDVPATATLPAAPTPGNLLVMQVHRLAGSGAVTAGLTQAGSWREVVGGSNAIATFYRVVQAGDGASWGFTVAGQAIVELSEWSSSAGWGSDPLDVVSFIATQTNTGGEGAAVSTTRTITPTASRRALIIANVGTFQQDTPTDVSHAAVSPDVLLDSAQTNNKTHQAVIYRTVSSTTGSYTQSVTYNKGFGNSSWAEQCTSFVTP